MSFRVVERLPKAFGEIVRCPDCLRRFHHCTHRDVGTILCRVERDADEDLFPRRKP